jgi:hypothetical protein
MLSLLALPVLLLELLLVSGVAVVGLTRVIRTDRRAGLAIGGGALMHLIEAIAQPLYR